MKARSALLALAGILTTSLASAAPPWVERRITLPEHDWAFDFGLGVGHENNPPRDSPTGPGLNLEGAVSVVSRLELGFRTGVRMGNEAREVHADEYGRLFDRQTFGTNNDVIANPEFRIRGALVETQVFELGLEGRVYLPVEQYSQFGMMFGMPLAFHFGHRVRLDTGVYVPILFYSPVATYVSAPIDVWIQVTHGLWLGPMGGFSFSTADNRGPVPLRGPVNHVAVPIGFGLGYQFTRTLDLKTMFLFPDVNHTQGAQDFGFGVGLQVRIE